VARGTRDTTIQVIEVSVSSLYYLSSVVALSHHINHGNTFVTSVDSSVAYKWETTKPAYNRKNRNKYTFDAFKSSISHFTHLF
jgi:hypothetical protein